MGKIVFYFLSIAMASALCHADTTNTTTQWYNNLYLRGDIGAFIPANTFKEKGPYLTKKFDASPIYNVGIGYKLNNMFRGDLNFSYAGLKYHASNQFNTTSTSVSQKTRLYNFFMNGYVDFDVTKALVPFLTAGIGYSHNRSSDLLDSDNDLSYPGSSKNNFAWNGGVGTRLILNDRFNLEISYKYVDLGEIKTKNHSTNFQGASQRIRSHNVMGGLIIHL